MPHLLLGWLAVLPSPASNIALQLGPLAIPWYGVGYAIALALGTWLTARLARQRGLDPNHVMDGLLVVVICGLIGARLYHVIDQWQLYQDDLLAIVLPPYSGLALYGGVIGGIVGLGLYTRHRDIPFRRWADTAVPALFFGQAIARWGNYANQELYGPPTDAPWGIAIDCAHRVAEFACPPLGTVPVDAGFQPLFLYESSMTFLGGLVALLLLVRFSARLKDGDVMALWLIWYGLLRTYLETFRLAYDFTFFGVPVAILLGMGAAIVGVAVLAWNHRERPRPPLEPDALEPDEPEPDEPEPEEPEPEPAPEELEPEPEPEQPEPEPAAPDAPEPNA
ncbi:MAG TPA: prolipoprotein diacylglyceryl transferase [Candidatus Limnocylindrales bacterium]|nr:prolipoprotein diacylglyceryl transferase [Candidatus Limnocylindrales bacterium]